MNKYNYLYLFQMDDDEVKKMKILYSLLWLIMTTSTILVGLIDTSSSVAFFVTVPYALMIIPEGFMALACFNTIFMVDIMVYKTFKRSVERMHKTSRLILIFAGLCCGGEIMFIAFNYKHLDLLRELLFLLGIVIALLSDICLVVLQKKYVANIVMIEKTNQENQDE